MRHGLQSCSFSYKRSNGASLIEAESALRAANSPQCYSKHENGNLLTGQHEVKGGWGGGVNLNISGAKAVAGGDFLQGIMNAYKMSNVALGLSYNRDAGLGMNVNTNFTNGLGLGLDYNFKSGDYTANASYDKNQMGGKDWANASFGISASKHGQANATASYNSDGNAAIPQRLR